MAAWNISVSKSSRGRYELRLRIPGAAGGGHRFFRALPPDFSDFKATKPSGGPTRNWRRPPASVGDDDLLFCAGDLDTLKEIGGRLYDSLFRFGPKKNPEDFTNTFLGLRAAAPDKRSGLGFEIDLSEAPELSRIPWEALYLAKVDLWLGIDAQTNIVRRLQPDIDVPLPFAVRPPIRMLVVVANPDSELKVGAEIGNIQRRLGSLPRENASYDIETLERATRADLRGRIAKWKPHIIHFIGHGGFDDEKGLIYLHSGRDPAARDAIDSETLRDLVRNDPPWLVVLNTCLSGAAAMADPFGGAAQSLIRANVPFVVAMQAPISDEAAIQFSQDFYVALASDDTVAAAVTRGRNGIRTLEDEGLRAELITPVLYSNGKAERISVRKSWLKLLRTFWQIDPADPSTAGMTGIIQVILAAVALVVAVVGIVIALYPSGNGLGSPPPASVAGGAPAASAARPDPGRGDSERMMREEVAEQAVRASASPAVPLSPDAQRYARDLPAEDDLYANSGGARQKIREDGNVDPTRPRAPASRIGAGRQPPIEYVPPPPSAFEQRYVDRPYPLRVLPPSGMIPPPLSQPRLPRSPQAPRAAAPPSRSAPGGGEANMDYAYFGAQARAEAQRRAQARVEAQRGAETAYAARQSAPRRAAGGSPLDLAQIGTICRAAASQDDPAAFIARLSNAYALSAEDVASLRAGCAAIAGQSAAAAAAESTSRGAHPPSASPPPMQTAGIEADLRIDQRFQIPFPSGRADLTPQARETLDAIALASRADPRLQIALNSTRGAYRDRALELRLDMASAAPTLRQRREAAISRYLGEHAPSAVLGGPMTGLSTGDLPRVDHDPEGDEGHIDIFALALSDAIRPPLTPDTAAIFEAGSASPSDMELNRYLGLLSRGRAERVSIELVGRTEPREASFHGDTLGRARAAFIARTLEGSGIAADQITVASAGDRWGLRHLSEQQFAWERRVDGRLVLDGLSRIQFAPGDAEVSEAGAAVLDGLAGFARENPDVAFQVEGHAQRREQDPFALAQSRAERVGEELRRRGVEARRIRILVYSDSRPEVVGHRFQGVDRRVQIVLIPPTGQQSAAPGVPRDRPTPP